MEVVTSRAGSDLNLASRKAQETAWRRFQATNWLESFVGSLGISSQPSEKEFISCLRNGLILCNAINKIQPGSVPKVVETSQFPSQSMPWDSQPLPAFQFFENVRNFLKAVEELNLPVFEASIFERDNLEEGSSAKIVDCVLGLKAYNEWKISGGNGSFRPSMRSPLVMYSNCRVPLQEPMGLHPCNRLDSPANCGKQLLSARNDVLEDSIAKALVECMVDAKENIDETLLSSFRNGNTNSIKSFGRIFSSALEEQFQDKYPELKSIFKDVSRDESRSGPPAENGTCCCACLNERKCKHWPVFQTQERELRSLKALLSSTKAEFGDLQSRLQNDLKQLESQMVDLSTAAMGYHKVVKENRVLYNAVQDLKGNIRVYCRIRPAFRADTKNVIDFIGEDGSLVVLDPSKPHKDGKKLFQFNRVFGPNATQGEVFADTRPLIRSVMDGYNVCIFAYGQTGSGKTHTMSGPPGGSKKELGINYLALNDLFELSNERRDVMAYDLNVQMVEIYNEQVRDLLCKDSARLEIRSCTSENGLSLPDAAMHPVNSTADVVNLMRCGEVNRAVSSTALNHQSSRSHSILTVHVNGKDVSGGGTVRSCLHLVDLAGSERVDKSEVTGESLKEAQHINKSLSCLGDVITALAQKSSYVPYRNSKLTLLLQNSLGGNAKTLMFAHVSPEGDSFGETVSTLKFAQRASSVELGAARSNKESREVLDLKEQVETLKRQLATKEQQSAQKVCRSEERRSPFQKPKAAAAMEKTPPRPRRLSIENKGVKSPSAVQIRTQRIFLEEAQEAAVFREKPVQPPPPKSPNAATNSAFKSRIPKTEGRMKLSSLVLLPKTPEPQIPVRNEGKIHLESKSSDVGKPSHIRKSLWTLGQLINGSEKRVQKVTEAPSPVLSSAARPSRRQSLSGSHLPDVSRRSSLGGGVDPHGAMKTPPRAHTATKKWM